MLLSLLRRLRQGRGERILEHYWDKEDLLTSQTEWLIESLDSQFETSSTPHSADASVWLPSLALFKHISERYALYQALLRGGAVALMTQALQQHLRVRVKTQLQATWEQNQEDDLLDAVAAYIVGTFVTLLQWWLETDMRWSPERMEILFHQLMLPGVRHLLEGKLPGAEHAPLFVPVFKKGKEH